MAEHFGVCTRTARNWIHRGSLAAGRPGKGKGRFVITPEAVESLMKPQQKETGVPAKIPEADRKVVSGSSIIT